MSNAWRLVRVSDGETFSLTDGWIKDAFNRFAREASAELDDPEGEKEAQFPKATPVSIEIRRDTDPGFHPRFGGFVIDSATDDNSLGLEILSHDFWLRRRAPIIEYQNETISSALQHLIVNYTPLVWNPNLIEIENDVEINREFRGEPVDSIIDYFSSRSAGEEFGANNDAEFFFRPSETRSAPTEFHASTIQPGSAEFEEDAKAEVNRVEIHYGEGDTAGVVAVQDRSSQRELQEELDAPRPVVIEANEDHPEIETEREAERLGRKYLEGRTAIRSGELRTWESFGVEPGMVVPVQIPEQNVDGDYRVAQIEYHWRDDYTGVSLAENREGVSDVLAELSEEVTRIDMKNADPDAAVSEHIDITSGAEFSFDATVTTRKYGSSTFTAGVNADEMGINREREFGISVADVVTADIRDARVTNAALNIIRDVWRGDNAPPDLATLLVGSGDSLPSKTDEALEAEFDSMATSIETVGDTAVEFVSSAEYEESKEIAELGVETASGELFARVATESIGVGAGEVADFQFEIDAQNDSERQSDFTTSGLEAVRDIMANNNPGLPDWVGYGTGELSDPTAAGDLAMRVASAPIEEFSNSGAGVVYLRSTLNGSDADGEDIQESGSFNGDDALLTYVTFASIRAESGVDIVTNDKTQFSNT